LQNTSHSSLGELDNSDEAGGTQIHTPLLDRYGAGRLDRGKIFFETGKRTAATMRTPFNWALQTVPGVGHDFRAMIRTAAKTALSVSCLPSVGAR
jgi:hypothetical protein